MQSDNYRIHKTDLKNVEQYKGCLEVPKVWIHLLSGWSRELDYDTYTHRKWLITNKNISQIFMHENTIMHARKKCRFKKKKRKRKKIKMNILVVLSISVCYCNNVSI